MVHQRTNKQICSHTVSMVVLESGSKLLIFAIFWCTHLVTNFSMEMRSSQCWLTSKKVTKVHFSSAILKGFGSFEPSSSVISCMSSFSSFISLLLEHSYMSSAFLLPDGFIPLSFRKFLSQGTCSY